MAEKYTEEIREYVQRDIVSMLIENGAINNLLNDYMQYLYYTDYLSSYSEQREVIVQRFMKDYSDRIYTVLTS